MNTSLEHEDEHEKRGSGDQSTRALFYYNGRYPEHDRNRV
jgi:hypothetical protein